MTRRHPRAAGLLAVLLGVALAFGAHAGWMLATRWSASAGPRVEGWMTPRLVLLTFRLPPDALLPVLGTGAADAPFVTLADLAAARGVPAADLVGAVGRAIATTAVSP